MIVVENLSKTYGSGDAAVNALKGVSLTINDGEMVAIIGTSGSGKSTLLHIIGGLDNEAESHLRRRADRIAGFRHIRRNDGAVQTPE